MYRYFLSMISVCVLFANSVDAEIIDGENFIDPTRPFFAIDTSDIEPDLTRSVIPIGYDLTFIRAGSSSPMAVINNRQVTIGDVVSNALVIAIERSSVTLLISGEERRIDLYGSVKAPVSAR